MGKPPKPKEDPELKAQQAAEIVRAKAEEKRLRDERVARSDSLRRQQTGLFSLIKTEGGELGAPKSLLLGASE